MKDKFLKLSNNVVKIFFGIFIFVYVILNILFSASLHNLDGFYIEINTTNIYTIIWFLLAFGCLWLLIKKDFFNINENYLIYGFLIICLIVGLVWIFNNNYQISEINDAYNIYETAKYLNNGDYSVLGAKSTISNYPNNVGLLFYDLFLIKVFGEVNALYAFRLINLVCVLIGYYALYQISKLIFNNNRTINCTLIYLLFGSMQFVFYSYFVYSNCLSYSLSIVSIWFLLRYFKNNRIKDILVTIISIVFSITIKENSLIVLITEIIYLILYIIKTKKVKSAIIIVVCMMLGTYLGTSGLQRYAGNLVNLDYKDTKMPTIVWVACGINSNPDSPGYYFNELENYHISHDQVADYTSIEAKRFIDNTLESFKDNPLSGINFYIRKFIAAWCNPTYEAFGQYASANRNNLVESITYGVGNKILTDFWDGIGTLVSLGLAIYLIKDFKNAQLLELIGAVIIIGGFLFHFIWEIKSIYLYQYFLFVLLYGAKGLVSLLKK